MALPNNFPRPVSSRNSYASSAGDSWVAGDKGGDRSTHFRRDVNYCIGKCDMEELILLMEKYSIMMEENRQNQSFIDSVESILHFFGTQKLSISVCKKLKISDECLEKYGRLIARHLTFYIDVCVPQVNQHESIVNDDMSQKCSQWIARVKFYCDFSLVEMSRTVIYLTNLKRISWPILNKFVQDISKRFRLDYFEKTVPFLTYLHILCALKKHLKYSGWLAKNGSYVLDCKNVKREASRISADIIPPAHLKESLALLGAKFIHDEKFPTLDKPIFNWILFMRQMHMTQFFDTINKILEDSDKSVFLNLDKNVPTLESSLPLLFSCKEWADFECPVEELTPENTNLVVQFSSNYIHDQIRSQSKQTRPFSLCTENVLSSAAEDEDTSSFLPPTPRFVEDKSLIAILMEKLPSLQIKLNANMQLFPQVKVDNDDNYYYVPFFLTKRTWPKFSKAAPTNKKDDLMLGMEMSESTTDFKRPNCRATTEAIVEDKPKSSATTVKKRNNARQTSKSSTVSPKVAVTTTRSRADNSPLEQKSLRGPSSYDLNERQAFESVVIRPLTSSPVVPSCSQDAFHPGQSPDTELKSSIFICPHPYDEDGVNLDEIFSGETEGLSVSLAQVQENNDSLGVSRDLASSVEFSTQSDLSLGFDPAQLVKHGRYPTDDKNLSSPLPYDVLSNESPKLQRKQQMSLQKQEPTDGRDSSKDEYGNFVQSKEAMAKKKMDLVASRETAKRALKFVTANGDEVVKKKRGRPKKVDTLAVVNNSADYSSGLEPIQF